MNYKIINRIRSTSLVLKNDGCYYSNSLFSGVAINIDQNTGSITNMQIYEQGKPTGDYIGEYLDYTNKLLVDEDFLTASEEGEPYFYNNELFSGIGFYFKNSICLSETNFCEGYRESSVENTPEGNIFYLALYDDLCQLYEWYKNGNFKKIEIYDESFQMFFCTNPENELESLGFEGGSFQKLEKLKNKIVFPIVEEPSLFCRILLGNRLFITGDHVTDDLFSNFLLNPSRGNVNELRMTKTALTEVSFLRISFFKNLKIINFEDMHVSNDILKKIKNELPNCTITINRREIAFPDT